MTTYIVASREASCPLFLYLEPLSPIPLANNVCGVQWAGTAAALLQLLRSRVPRYPLWVAQVADFAQLPAADDPIEVTLS